jgi:hypothetical protein
MNMMTMAKMEEAIDKAWMKWPLPSSLRHPSYAIFADGFRAGAAWAISQAETQTSSQAVGNISQYPAAVEEPEEEV